jgi:transcriptional regulator with XRE-family HTH domain
MEKPAIASASSELLTFGLMAKRQRRSILREGRPLVLADIGQLFGHATSLYSNIENGRSLPRRLDTLKEYLDALGIDVVDVLRDYEAVRNAYRDAVEADPALRAALEAA